VSANTVSQYSHYFEFELNLIDVEKEKRLAAWCEFVALSQCKIPEEMSSIWRKAHLYLHQCKYHLGGCYVLKTPQIYDPHCKLLTVSEICSTTIDLMAYTPHHRSAKRVLESLKGWLPTPLPAELRAAELLPDDPKEAALREKIALMRLYLASKGLYGGYHINLTTQKDFAEAMIWQYWCQFEMPGLFVHDVPKACNHQELLWYDKPQTCVHKQSLWDEFEKLPSTLHYLRKGYLSLLLDDVHQRYFHCRIDEEKLPSKYLQLIKTTFMEVVVANLKEEHRTSGGTLQFNAQGKAGEPDPLYVKIFIDFILKKPRETRWVIAYHYQESLLEVLPYCHMLELRFIPTLDQMDVLRGKSNLHFSL
jgi:hypothetical protein